MGKAHPLHKSKALYGVFGICLMGIALYFGWKQTNKANLRRSIPKPNIESTEPRVNHKLNGLMDELHEDPNNSQRWGMLAINFQAHDFLREALECYSKAHQLDPRQFTWPYLAAVLQSQEWVTESALVWFDIAKNIRKDYSPLYIRLGNLYYKLGRLPQAQSAYLKASELMGDKYFISFGLAQVAMAQSLPGDAKEYLHDALQIHPKSKEAAYLLSDAYQKSGSEKLAQKIRPHPDSTGVQPTLEDSLFSMLAFEGVSSSWYEKRGLSYLNQGLWVPAIKEFLNQINAKPVSSAFENLTIALIEINPSTLAQDKSLLTKVSIAIERNIKNNPDNWDLVLCMGLISSAAEDFQNSNKYLFKYLKHKPQALILYTTIGVNYKGLGKYLKSAEIYQSGLRYFPNNMFMKTSVALIYANAENSTLKQKQQALNIAKELSQEKGPYQAKNLDLLSLCYYRLNQKSLALKTAKQGLALAQKNQDQAMIQILEKKVSTYQ